jgi:hypothetical protein
MTTITQAKFKVGAVPCAGCTLCCKGDAIRLLPGDNANNYQTEKHPYVTDALMLAHKPNHDCIYLIPGGCLIHSTRPQQCREMDCRLIASKINFTQARKHDKSNLLKISVWKKGKELLRATQ